MNFDFCFMPPTLPGPHGQKLSISKKTSHLVPTVNLITGPSASQRPHSPGVRCAAPADPRKFRIFAEALSCALRHVNRLCVHGDCCILSPYRSPLSSSNCPPPCRPCFLPVHDSVIP